jgi:hypothetical protein
VLMGTLTSADRAHPSPFDINIAGHRRSLQIWSPCARRSRGPVLRSRRWAAFSTRCSPLPRWTGF